MFKRLHLICIESEDEDDKLPILVDCKISKDEKIEGAWTLFGIWGMYSADPDDIYPFVIDKNGKRQKPAIFIDTQ